MLSRGGADADAVLRDALKGCLKSLDCNHLTTITVLSQLAAIYTIKGDLETAGQYLIESVEIARMMFGPDHALTDGANRAMTRRGAARSGSDVISGFRRRLHRRESCDHQSHDRAEY